MRCQFSIAADHRIKCMLVKGAFSSLGSSSPTTTSSKCLCVFPILNSGSACADRTTRTYLFDVSGSVMSAQNSATMPAPTAHLHYDTRNIKYRAGTTAQSVHRFGAMSYPLARQCISSFNFGMWLLCSLALFEPAKMYRFGRPLNKKQCVALSLTKCSSVNAIQGFPLEVHQC